jgi:hypothetical protein
MAGEAEALLNNQEKEMKGKSKVRNNNVSARHFSFSTHTKLTYTRKSDDEQ